MSSEVIAAILGALLAGGFQTIVNIFDRRREDEAVLVAIAAEVDALCRLIRHQEYLSDVRQLLEELEGGESETVNYVVDIRNDYFTVYNALAYQLGRLKPESSARIIKFYAYCKTIIDGTRPDGIAAQQRDKSESILAMRSLVELLSVVLELGDHIVQLPKNPLLGSEQET